MKELHQELFKPIRIGKLELKNRYAMAPMASFGLVDENGILTDDGVEYFVTRAKGGAGLIMTGTCFVEDEVEGILPHTLMCTDNTDKWIEMQQFNKLAERCHAYGSKVFVQLASGYGRSARIPTSATKAVAPSEIPNRWDPTIIHREITKAEIKKIVDAFGKAAAFCRKCGIDGVEVHAVHEGYLLDQFTVPFFNKRTDEYGGSFENRYRFAVEVVESIKEACGKDYPVSLRFTLKHYIKDLLSGGVEGEEFEEMGRDTEEGLKAAKYLVDAGYDALSVDLGCYDAHYWNHPSVYQRDGLYLEAAEMVKKVVDVPILVAGRMDNPDFGSKSIEEGKCDILAIGRPLLADPELPNKVATGKLDMIRPCISCNYGCCTKVHQSSGRAGCAVNAQCANELNTEILPVVQKKNVVVIGGGPGGCECARVLRLRGHRVTLLEKEDKLGGALNIASQPSFKKHDLQLIRYFESELSRLGVEVKTSCEASVDSVGRLNPDVIIVASGAKACAPSFPGADKCKYAEEILVMNTPEGFPKDVQLGENIVIIGAGQVGVETGLMLLMDEKNTKRNVTIVEITNQFMPQALYSDSEHARALLDFYEADVMLETKVEKYEYGVLSLETNDGKQIRIPADEVILATGYRSDTKVYEDMRNNFDIVYNIGDSSKARNIYFAIHEANELARYI